MPNLLVSVCVGVHSHTMLLKQTHYSMENKL